ncbi:hypothetical protein B0H34DRAFT_700765 [Crassisporium funariophilum]|nr:hypothetical protein B0H34DRAFT_700765 [Crassisporium funariophilum]
MVLPPQNLLAWEISFTLLHTISIGFTLVRLVHHWRMGRLWWDDYVVCFPLLTDCFYVISIWLRLRDGLEASTGPKYQGVFYSTWLSTNLFFTIIWASRISLSLSIARIFPSGHRCRQFAFGLVASFLLAYISSLLLATLTCRASQSAWYLLKLSNCLRLKNGQLIGSLTSLAPFYIAIDLVADVLLIITPSVMLWKVKLPTNERRLILVLFSSSIFTLLSAIPFAFIWFFGINLPPDSRLTLFTMTPMLETAVSLLVCNLTIVTMLFYRMLNRKSPGPEIPPREVQRAHTVDDRTTNTQAVSQSHYSGSQAPPVSRTCTNMTFTSIYDEESFPPPLPCSMALQSKQ